MSVSVPRSAPAPSGALGKRGGSVVDANLAVIEEAYDGLIDVTAHVTAIEPGEVAPGSGRQSEGVLP